MTTIPVKVLLNITSRFREYGEHDSLYEAITFDSPPPACGSMARLLEIIWDQLNIDEPRAQWAIEYRHHRNRSLSVGDVVVLGERAWTCDIAGWRPVSLEASQVWYYLGVVADGSEVYEQPRAELQ